MKIRELRERLLVGTLIQARSVGFGGFFDPAEIADKAGIVRQPGQLRLVVQELDGIGLINASFTLGGGDEGGLDFQITASGVEEAEEILERHPEYQTDIEAAPASDRYVTLTDNSRADLAADLSELADQVRRTNDVDDDDRAIALSEIAILEATLAQPRVPLEFIERFTNRIVSWLRAKFPDALLGAVVGVLVEKLLGLLS